MLLSPVFAGNERISNKLHIMNVDQLRKSISLGRTSTGMKLIAQKSLRGNFRPQTPQRLIAHHSRRPRREH